MAERRSNSGGLRRYARRALAVTLGLLCGLGLAEAAFSARDQGAFPHLNVYVPDAGYGVRLRPGATTRIAFGGAPVSSVSIHGGGFRGEDSGAEPRIVQDEVLFVGDSQTFGLGVEAGEAFAARFGKLAKRPVYNAGVPTWGPPEFLRAIKELGQRRHPSTVVYVVNFANDPFEAERPNARRHAVWDGWAVRRETAPTSVTAFPGRDLLFRRSHLVFAFRQWWHGRGAPPAQDVERGTPSEGTFRDLFQQGQALSQQQLAAREETERRAALYESEATYAQEAYRLAESRVRALVWSELKLGEGGGGYDPGAQGSVYLAADANPGDIVTPGTGEEGRAAYATALYIRQAVELRNRFEAELTKRARAALETEQAKQILGALSERDQQRIKLAAMRAKPLELVRATSPLTRTVLNAKERAEALGARFVLLVLPLDVMVSDAEWPKQGKHRVDLSTAHVLIQDLVDSVREAGGTAVDATQALAAAEPGAFLPGDIHLTPKGHGAVASALLEALKSPAKLSAAPQLALAPGRSRVPPPATWDSLGGEVAVNGSAGCPVTRKYREWLYVRCFPANAKAPQGIGLQVVQGGLGDAITWVRDGQMTLVAPIPSGSGLEALFTWSDGKTKRLRVVWDAAGNAPDFSMAVDAAASAALPGDAAAADKVCACYQGLHPGAACGSIIANADASCVETYGADCGKLLACAEGDALFPPHCSEGFSNAGASLHCARGVVAAAAKAASIAPPSAAAATASELQAAASELIKAAQAFVGDRCRLGEDEVEFFAGIPYDRCPTDASMVSAYEHAWSGFAALAERTALSGAGATFRDQARAFGEFTKAALAANDTRGTAAFFQDLALTYNRFQSGSPIAVDPPRIVALYFGVSGLRSSDYLRNLKHDGQDRRAAFLASGKHFTWLRGPNGFQGPFLDLPSHAAGTE